MFYVFFWYTVQSYECTERIIGFTIIKQSSSTMSSQRLVFSIQQVRLQLW